MIKHFPHNFPTTFFYSLEMTMMNKIFLQSGTRNVRNVRKLREEDGCNMWFWDKLRDFARFC